MRYQDALDAEASAKALSKALAGGPGLLADSASGPGLPAASSDGSGLPAVSPDASPFGVTETRTISAGEPAKLDEEQATKFGEEPVNDGEEHETLGEGPTRTKASSGTVAGKRPATSEPQTSKSSSAEFQIITSSNIPVSKSLGVRYA